MGETMRVFVACPIYKPMSHWDACCIIDEAELGFELPEEKHNGLHPAFGYSLHAAARYLHEKGIEMRFEATIGSTNVDISRAYLLGIWKQLWDAGDRYDRFITMDSDLSFPDWAIHRLAESGLDLVGGTYPFKATHGPKNGRACIRYLDEDTVISSDGYKQVKYLPGGFTMSRSRMLLDMIGKYDCLRFDASDVRFDDERTVDAWALYSPIVVGDVGKRRVLLSDDYAFCEYARRLGYTPQLDMRLQMKHWEGSTGFSLERRKVLVPDG
jgi:hypothetical protein